MFKRNTSLFDLMASAVLVVGLTFGVACGDDSGGGDDEAGTANPPVGARPDPATLDEWNLFANAATQAPYSDVIPYEMTSPLFTDYATKHRFIYVPEGEQIEYDPTAKWVFPEGSVLVKTFAYPVDERDPSLGEQLIETRLLINEGDNGWRPIVYEWNAAQTEAVIRPGGATVPVSYTLADGNTRDIPEYQIPSHGACRQCHGTVPDTAPIGPSTGALNRDNDYGSGPENQVDHLHALGLFDQAPDAIGARLAYPDPFTTDITVSETDKGRSYLDVNCAHCHSPTGSVSDKELYLDWASTDPSGTTLPFHWGVCKKPTSAGGVVGCDGLDTDVRPGDAENSLLACRVETIGAGLMPELGRTLQHAEGLAVVEDWINAMNLAGCDD